LPAITRNISNNEVCICSNSAYWSCNNYENCFEINEDLFWKCPNKIIAANNMVDTASGEHKFNNPRRHSDTLRVFPNPAKNVFYIKISGKKSIILKDAEGCQVFKVMIRERATVDINRLPAGIYYVIEEKTGDEEKLLIVK
jgi:hypothetical protein